MVDLFVALKLNRTLKLFTVTNDGTPNILSPKASNAYLEMMQFNCSLVDMFVTYPTYHFHPHTMWFYSKLNQMGRRKFLHESHLVSRREWVDMLGEVSDDERCLFYFLRLISSLGPLIPCLCNTFELIPAYDFLHFHTGCSACIIIISFIYPISIYNFSIIWYNVHMSAHADNLPLWLEL